ncbi:hypothetical protein C3L33_11136, partial [Rhododendron williamsianum]
MENHHLLHQSQPLKSRFKRVCVFCGSSPGKSPSYKLAAIQLGNELVERKIDLVYGGGSIGLMGLVSQAVYDGGRHVVIPKTLMPREITGETVGEVRPVAGMHQRKAEMARQADAFVALPDKAVDEGFIAPSARHIIEYVPEHSGVASKLTWEMEQQLGYTTKSDIAR